MTLLEDVAMQPNVGRDKKDQPAAQALQEMTFAPWFTAPAEPSAYAAGTALPRRRRAVPHFAPISARTIMLTSLYTLTTGAVNLCQVFLVIR